MPPALAAADVGVAMGISGSAATAEVADVVLLVIGFYWVEPAIEIARRSRRIALQSVYAGIGLSVAGMMAASFSFTRARTGGAPPGDDRCRGRVECVAGAAMTRQSLGPKPRKRRSSDRRAVDLRQLIDPLQR